MSIILIGLYIYIIIKAYLLYRKKLNIIRSSRYEFLEILAFSLTLGFLFNFIYPKNIETQHFIISKNILWVSFIASLLMFGVGIGVRFVSEVLKNFFTEDTIISEKVKLIHDFYSQIWITINVGFISFLFSLIELSNADIKDLRTVEIIVIAILSVFLGVLYGISNKGKTDIQKIIVPLFALFGICIFMLTLENSTYYSIKGLPITNSFLIFSVSFVITNLYLILLPKAGVNISALKFGIKKKDGELKEISETDLEVKKKSDQNQSKIVTYKPEKESIIKVNAPVQLVSSAKPKATKKIAKTKKIDVAKKDKVSKAPKGKKEKGPAVLSLSSLKSEY